MKKVLRTMRKEVRDYPLPSYGVAYKVSNRADYKAYCRIYLDVFGHTLNRRLALWLLKKEIYKRSYVWYTDDGRMAGIYALIIAINRWNDGDSLLNIRSIERSS